MTFNNKIIVFYGESRTGQHLNSSHSIKTKVLINYPNENMKCSMFIHHEMNWEDISIEAVVDIQK